MAEPITTHRVERLRLYPHSAQAAQLRNFAGARRWTWNWALAERKRAYEETGKGIGYAEQGRQLTAIQRDPDHVWLNEIPRRVKAEALRDLDRAYTAAFRRLKEMKDPKNAGKGIRPGFPTFKSRKRGAIGFRIPAEVHTRRPEGEGRGSAGSVRLPRLGWVRARGWMPEEPGTLKGGSITCDRVGDWWISLYYEVVLEPAVTDLDAPVGVHLQLRNTLSLSTGETIAAAPMSAKEILKSKRLHMAVSRKKRGSKNRDRARRRLAHFERKVANRRDTRLHQISHEIVSQHPRLAMQVRETASMMTDPESQRAVWGGRKRTARIADAAWSRLTFLLTYKAEAGGHPIVWVPADYPSARTCSHCGHVLPELDLMIAAWACPRCGTHHQRGENAAKNILSVGYPDSSGSRNDRLEALGGR